MKFEEHQPPEHLSGRAKKLWARLVPRHVRAFSRVALLQSALECLDVADRARAELAGQSLTVKTLGSGTVHANPLLKVEKESRQQFANLWASLGLNSKDLDSYSVAKWLEFQKEREESP